MLDKHVEDKTLWVSKWVGTSAGLMTAVGSIAVWLIAGAFVDYSSAWQSGLTIYIAILTFLMIFLIQRGQNKEVAALHLKLNELISVTGGADNKVIKAEHLSEMEIDEVKTGHHWIADNSSSRSDDPTG